MSDPIYTPPQIAKAMAHAIARESPSVIVDIAVGGGELLRAAETRWPKSRFYGLDVDAAAIRRLRRRHVSWNLQKGDLLALPFLRRALPKADVILLNPPFSCRGASRTAAEIDGQSFRVSLALACLIRALAALKRDGEIAALMPAGSLHSEKDNAAWIKIRTCWEVIVVRECDRNTFQSFYPSTVLLHLQRRSAPVPTQGGGVVQSSNKQAILMRGKVQMHTVGREPSASVPLLHTTDLLTLQGYTPEVRVKLGHGMIQGSCILLPRVGSPDLRKFVQAEFSSPIRLSDCLFALRSATPKQTGALYEELKARWSDVANLYVGTGAKFITKQRLAKLLQELEYDTVTVQNMCKPTTESSPANHA